MADPSPKVPSEVDVLVLGAGMAGLTAAAAAATDGARVMVVEKASHIGGSTLFAGYAWTAPSRDVMDEINPGGDRDLRNAIVDQFADGVSWIRSLGIHVGEEQAILGWGAGSAFDTHQYLDAARRRVTQNNGVVLTSTETRELLHENGAAVGAVLRLSTGEEVSVRARSTVLATGGFQNNRALRAERIHPHAAGVAIRSNPTSAGDGLRLATTLGAASGPENAGFYGHLVPAGIPLHPEDFIALALYYSEHALLFNLDNQRFVDESIGDHLSTMALLEQSEARGLLIGDARVHRDWIVKPYVANAEANDKFALADRRGARCGVAHNIEELSMLPEDWGYDGAAIARVVTAYNESVGRGRRPNPDRALDRVALDEPPYYVIEVAPAITFPFNGLRIDADARVLNGDGMPIPGLLAAGADAGGFYRRAYAGGLAAALVFGRAAARTATAASAAG